ncbi:MAG TPA: 4Fe-4S single cluster domain-containing protein, partial [Nannocystis sp.]
PFRRAALWVQGCSLACPGCCNPELFLKDGGTQRSIAALVDELRKHREQHAIEGLTVLGGEPSEQLPSVTALCREARRLGLGVIVFTGRTEAELAALPGGPALLATVDTLVDGRFDATCREPADGRRFIGSSNQRLVHRSPRYADPALWRGPRGVELQLTPDGQISLHGTPALARRLARALAERPEPRAGGPARIFD